jgi:hypothetical protein
MSDRPETAERSAPTDPDAPARQVDGSDRDRVDEQEDESFPASDPHSDWAGAPPEGDRT